MQSSDQQVSAILDHLYRAPLFTHSGTDKERAHERARAWRPARAPAPRAGFAASVIILVGGEVHPYTTKR